MDLGIQSFVSRADAVASATAVAVSALVALLSLGGGAGCDSKQAAPEAPVPPVIMLPEADEAVRSPVVVLGTGIVGASVTVTLTGGDAGAGAQLAVTTAVVDAEGAFTVEVPFADQTIGAPLELAVVQATADGTSVPTERALVQGALGNTYATAAEAPTYQGAAYDDMQIFDVARDVFLDDVALLEALDGDQAVYFGEQHETAPIHELQLWLLQGLTARHDDVTLAMEHFQADEQDVLDDYLDGTITDSQFIAASDPWPNFAQYWKPLVDHMKAIDRPVVATNIPNEALDAIYANGLSSPLAFFNSWGPSSPQDAYLPPRPVLSWDALYQDYFETGFDYAAHGQSWGLTYQQALDYFTDLAVIRDHTMGYWVAGHIDDTGNRVLFVGGDWHVQTGIATPTLAAFWSSTITSQSLITTTPRAAFESLRAATFQGHPYADYILLYD